MFYTKANYLQQLTMRIFSLYFNVSYKFQIITRRHFKSNVLTRCLTTYTKHILQGRLNRIELYNGYTKLFFLNTFLWQRPPLTSSKLLCPMHSSIRIGDFELYLPWWIIQASAIRRVKYGKYLTSIIIIIIIRSCQSINGLPTQFSINRVDGY